MTKNLVYGVGDIGIGKFKSRQSRTKMSRSYTLWVEMLRRCYSLKEQEKNKTYSECSVSLDWHNYQTFAEWFENQIDGENFQLDKDLLLKGNKIYSQENCCLIPPEINSFLNKRKRCRGNLPVGVSWDKRSGKYLSQGNFKGFSKKFIGKYDTKEEAFVKYKERKESHAKFLAEKFKEKVGIHVYNALLNYEVEIDD